MAMATTAAASTVVATATARHGVDERRRGMTGLTMRARGRCVAGGGTLRTTTVLVRARKGLLAEKFAEREESVGRGIRDARAGVDGVRGWV